MDPIDKFTRIVKTSRLPTLPEVAQKLVDLAQQADPDTNEVCRVIKSDSATCCKILKTVNSVLFAFRPRIETVEQAVPKLGMSLIRTLILNFHIASIKPSGDTSATMFQDLWKSSITQAVIAELLAGKVGEDPHFYFMCGMLQDVGILSMINEFPEDYQKHVLKNNQFPEVVAAEREFFGFSHVEVTTEILKRWNIGESHAKLVRNHHNRFMGAVEPLSRGQNSVVLQAANWGADLIARKKKLFDGANNEISQWLDLLQSQFSLNPESAENFLLEVEERVNDFSLTFGFDIGAPLEVDSLVSRAKEILHDIALTNQLNLMGKGRSKSNTAPEENDLYIDCLTGLFNRRYLNEVLGEKVEDWLELQQPVAVMFLDADKFKDINDVHGHSAGDEAILHIGKWLDKNVRSLDYVLRLGGDEFLVVMQTDFEIVQQITNRIIEEIPPLKLAGGTVVEMSLSAGCSVSQLGAKMLVDLNDLIDAADQLMYRAKKLGGAHCCTELIEKRKSSFYQQLFGRGATKATVGP